MSSTPTSSSIAAPSPARSHARSPQRNRSAAGVHRSPLKHKRNVDRERSKKEAKECLNVLHREGFQLDGFNLLGVVANPRAGMIGTSSHSRHHNESTHNTTTETTAEEESTDYFTGAVSSFGATLGQVTEQIETVNLFLEELSRQYLGDDSGESHFLEYYYQEEEHPTEEPPLPAELANLDLKELHAYLARCGSLAQSLVSQPLETSTLPLLSAEESASNQEGINLRATAMMEELTDKIPEIFFDEDFDLTQSETFCKLLLHESEATSTPGHSLYQSTEELLPAREQDVFAVHLDKVELALQEQVRLKAGAFFQETNRFRQLQSSIQELLVQVKTLRKDVQTVLSVYRQTKGISNHRRQDYELLMHLMEAATELIQTKSSIGGLLSANDHLGAVQQIQYGRRLLSRGISSSSSCNDETDTSSSSHTQHPQEQHKSLQLQNMVALSSCKDQFQQYESLVVQSLSEEMVDIFFNWRSTEKERVKEMVQALTLCHALSKTGELYNRRLQQTIRMTVRTTIAEFVETSGTAGAGVTGMSNSDFFSCLELLMEELHNTLQMARQVQLFVTEESIFPESEENWTKTAMTAGADLAAKSVAELLRLRKEAHSLMSLDEIKQLWDTCFQFIVRVEEEYGNNTKAVGLRSTLSGQAKAFVDRKHESNMSALVAALDSERWTPCEVSSERQAALTRLCTGRAMAPAATWRDSGLDNTTPTKNPTAEVEGVQYKVVWSCLLLVEMIVTNLHAAGHFSSLATNAVAKVAELMRLFNTRTTNLVLGAGAIHSAARLKSINAKHLSMVTQCLGMMTALLPHIRAALMAQLPSKQHALLNDLDKIKKDYLDHNEKVLNKFVTIIGGIIEHGLAPRIPGTDFDTRGKDLPNEGEIACCVFLDGVSTNTRKMHQVLSLMLPPDHLQDVFSRIFAYVDNQVPALFNAASNASTNNGSPGFSFPSTDDGKRRLLMEIEATTEKLNSLQGVLPWDFTCTNVLERKLDFYITGDNAGSWKAMHKNANSEATSEVEELPTSKISSEEKDEEGLVDASMTNGETSPVTEDKSADTMSEDDR